MTDLKSQVKGWLKGTGYPFEMQVAKCLQEAGFGISPSEYFEDSETGKWRETDVVAYEQYKNGDLQFNFALIAECKGEKEEPWVLFSNKDQYPESLSISRRATSNEGRKVLRALTQNQAVKTSPLFAVPERSGYNLIVKSKTQGGNGKERTNKDVAYNALDSVLKATMGLVGRLEKMALTVIPFVWPVIVINSPLFEAYLDDSGELQVNEINKGLLIWKKPVIANNTFVEIYTKDEFFSEAKNIREEAVGFLKLAAHEHANLPSPSIKIPKSKRF
jgi:hypothetical protein